MTNLEEKLGAEVTDTVTGFKGIAIARVVYLNGCIQIQVAPSVDKNGDQRKSCWIDESQLEVTGRGVLTKDIAKTGGGFREHPNEE